MTAQPPAKPGGTDAVGGDPSRPNVRDLPSELSPQENELRSKQAPSWVRHRGDAPQVGGNAVSERPKSARSPPAEAKAASTEEVAPGQDGHDNPLDAPGANPATQSDGDH
eukprot:9490864-Pyramimonas_sp.AAC.1